MGKLNIDDAERKRRSEVAKQMHKEVDPLTGRRKFGGPQPGSGRPRKKRATERLNEHIENHADEIWDRLYREMKTGKSMPALMAIKQMIEITNKETDLQAREDKSLENTSTEELMELVATRMARIAESGALPFDVELGDDDITESEQEALPGGSETSGSDVGAEAGPEDAVEAGPTGPSTGTSAFARRTRER